ncbi:PGPGW domain-containing protein [Thermopirellula anaerolimosa]
MKSADSERTHEEHVGEPETVLPTAVSSPSDTGLVTEAKAEDETPRILGAAWAVRWVVKYGYRMVRRVVVAVVGFSVLLVGLVMVIGPGPAVVVIPLGLAILAVEFRWARRLLRYCRQRLQSGIHDLAQRTGMTTKSTEKDDENSTGEKSRRNCGA